MAWESRGNSDDRVEDLGVMLSLISARRGRFGLAKENDIISDAQELGITVHEAEEWFAELQRSGRIEKTSDGHVRLTYQ